MLIGKRGYRSPRKLVPTAVAASLSLLAPTSHAQSSITLYGIIDTGVEYINNTGSGSLARGVSGNPAGSRWGMSGSEGLGGDLSAIFTLEGGFTANDGQMSQSTKGLGANASTTTRLFGRLAFVGLREGVQQITLGRQNSLEYDEAVIFAPMGAAPRYTGFAIDYDWTGRIDDSIKYKGSFGPVTVAGMFSITYNTGYGGEVPGAQTTGRFYSGSMNFAQGPIVATVLYEQRNSNTVQTASASERRIFAAASYDFGPGRAMAGWRFLKADASFLPTDPVLASPGASAGYASLFWGGARYVLTPALQLTAIACYQDEHRSASSSLMGLFSVDYALSKRTDVYVTMGYAKNDSQANLGLNGYGSSIATGYNQTGAVIGSGSASSDHEKRQRTPGEVSPPLNTCGSIRFLPLA